MCGFIKSSPKKLQQEILLQRTHHRKCSLDSDSCVFICSPSSSSTERREARSSIMCRFHRPLAILLALLGSTSFAFQTPLSKRVGSPLQQASVAIPEATSSQQEEQATTWECDDEANCVQVPACDDEVCRTSLDVRIHGNWYDLSGWRKAHPAGEHWIDWYDGRDATEVMDAFHSEKGRRMYQKLPKSKSETSAMLEATTVPDSETQINFRKLRDELEADGWWERNMVHEATQLALWGSCVVGAGLTAESAPLLSTSLLAISMSAAGWLGHDYIHGVDPFSDKMRNFAALAAGLCPTWWSDKVRLSRRIDDVSVSSITFSQMDSTTSITRSPTSRVLMKILRRIPSFTLGPLIRPKTLHFERFSTTSFGFHSRSSLHCGGLIHSKLRLMLLSKSDRMPRVNCTVFWHTISFYFRSFRSAFGFLQSLSAASSRL